MKLKNLDEIAEDFEKDFLIFNLTKRYILSLEVKTDCNSKNLESAWSQIKNCRNLIDKWCGADLTQENGWKFYSAMYFQRNSEKFSFCEKCARYIIIGEAELKDKFNKMTNDDIPDPIDYSKKDSAKVGCIYSLSSIGIISDQAH